MSGRWAGQEARANDQGRERAGERAQGAVSSGTLVNLTLLRCPATAASAELAAARPQAAISVLVKASRTGCSASHPAPRGAAQLPAPFACAGSIARTASSRVHLSCFVWSLVQPVCGPLGRGVQYGPVGTSAGQIKGSVTVPYTFHGAGSPLPRVAAAKKAALVQTDEGSLWAKQPVQQSRR